MAAPAAVALALGLALSLTLASAPQQQDLRGGAPYVEMLYAGSFVAPPLVELHASPEPAGLEIVAGGVGEGAEVSVRVVRSSHWGSAGATPPAAPALDDHGGGEATLTVDRSSPGELALEASASGASGGASALYVVRVLDALPPPGGHDGAPPSRIVGHLDPSDPALPRILAQAGRPVCAGEAHARGAGMRVPEDARDGWDGRPTMSGVPPIEGIAVQEAEVRDPAGDTTSDHPSWWGCYTMAVFGTQVTQWRHLCDVPGSDRTRYYARELGGGGGGPLASWAINPHTGELNRFSEWQPQPQAAAPGPHWFRTYPDWYSGYPPPGFDPHAPIPPDAHVPFSELFFAASGSVKSMWTRVKGTFSWAPELLPLDGRVVLRATAFHSDDITFRTEQPPGAPPALPGLHATVNGTLVPAVPVPGPHSLHPDGIHYFQNGTAVLHHGRAHGSEAAATGTGARQGPWEPHWHSPPHVTASVRVSDIALRNGVLIEGITDGIAGLPRELQLDALRARGVQGEPDVGAMEVKRLHEVTLVAELPVGVLDGEAYARVGPEAAVAPWECWPRLYHPPACLEAPWDECPSGRSGAAWVP